MILLIDNYDSFTYNLYQYLKELGAEVEVRRNDAVTLEEIGRMAPEGLVISPGPGRPEEAGVTLEAIRAFAGKIPILGVCLGHQAIGMAFGGKVVAAPTLMHGKTSMIHHDGKGLFKGLPNPFEATRYHSLVVSPEGLPEVLEVSARTEDGVVMALRHRSFPLEGIQFHPESVMTAVGKDLLKNFLASLGKGSVSRGMPADRADQEAKTPPEFSAASCATDFTPFLERAMSGTPLPADEMRAAVGLLMEGRVPDLQAAAFLAALRARGETAGELAAAAEAMMDKAVRVGTTRFCVDTCGTGGDGAGTFNISTAAAFVAAGAGVTVAKHGNRSVTSRCGSADVLEALGVKIDAEPRTMVQALEEDGIAFFFAPLYHPAMRHVMAARKALKVRTMFNILGPLCNPASARGRVLGVFEPSLLDLLARVLPALGVERAFVLRSLDGMDELSLNAPADIVQVSPSGLRRLWLDPERLGFRSCAPSALAGGDAAENAAIIRSVLEGDRGPRRDIVVLNAAAAILVAGSAKDFGEALETAGRAIDSGAALAKLEALRKRSHGTGG